MATSQVETVNAGADKAKVAASIALVVVALAAFFLLAKQGAVVQWVALLAVLGAAVAVFMMSESGRQLKAFGQEAVREVRKVVWPTRQETTRTMWVVFAVVILISLMLAGMDLVIQWAVKWLLGNG